MTKQPAIPLDLPDPIKGALWYIAAGVSWALMGGVVRYLSAGLPIFEVIFFRAFLGLAVMLPWLVHWRLNPIPQRHRGVYSLRGLAEIGAMMSWYTAIALMPVADVVALGFAAPLFATLLAVLFLHERVGLRRGLAIAIGMCGALLIVRPGFQELSLAAILAIAAALATAVSRISARKLSQTEDPTVIVASIGLFTVPATLVPALAVWQMPDLPQAFWLIVMGGLGTLGHVCLTQALRVSEASELAPYDFAQLLTAVAFGIAVFGEAPDLWTSVGAVVVAGTAVYVVRREAQLRRLSLVQGAAPRNDQSGTG
jgi:drug/metabolite transporter (DMT)-like permease